MYISTRTGVFFESTPSWRTIVSSLSFISLLEIKRPLTTNNCRLSVIQFDCCSRPTLVVSCQSKWICTDCKDPSVRNSAVPFLNGTLLSTYCLGNLIPDVQDEPSLLFSGCRLYWKCVRLHVAGFLTCVRECNQVESTDACGFLMDTWSKILTYPSRP